MDVMLYLQPFGQKIPNFNAANFEQRVDTLWLARYFILKSFRRR